VEPYRASGEINFVVTDPVASMAKVETMFPDAVVDHLDGLSVDLGDFWFNLRPSNTEPLLRLNVEAEDERAMEKALGQLTETLEESR
jgi:phosphomannomutase